MNQEKNVVLINGEEVAVNLNEICVEQSNFIRIGPKLLVSTPKDYKQHQGVYFWQEVDGIYKYLGDAFFKEKEDDNASFVLSVYPNYPASYNDSKNAAEFFIQNNYDHIELIKDTASSPDDSLGYAGTTGFKFLVKGG